jgi:hypothetical protein
VPYGTWNAPFFDVEILSPGHVVECNTYNNCWHVDYSAFFHQHLYDTPFEWIMINREYPSHWSYNQVYNHLKNKILTSDDGYRVKIGKLKEHFYYSDPGYHAWHHELCYIK